MKDFCIILMFNKRYLGKAYTTISQIRDIGLYKGDIVCLISDDLKNHPVLPRGDHIIIKRFPEISKHKILGAPKKNPVDAGKKKLVQICFPMSTKFIHYQKFYCFHTYFKENYKKCFYIDTDTQIFKPLDKIINLDCTDKFLAHSDAYPFYKDKLSVQFDAIVFPELFDELNRKYDLDRDHFQTTVILYDTSIINDDTFDELVRLANIYVNSKTNDQAILNIYFSCIRNKWEQIKIKDDKTHYYDFYERFELTKNDYIMVKYPKT